MIKYDKNKNKRSIICSFDTQKVEDGGVDQSQEACERIFSRNKQDKSEIQEDKQRQNCTA